MNLRSQFGTKTLADRSCSEYIGLGPTYICGKEKKINLLSSCSLRNFCLAALYNFESGS